MANNWYQHFLEWKDNILHVVSFLAGAAASKAYDAWKRIRFSAVDWKLWYVSLDSSHSMVYKETPPGFMFEYHFTARFFSEKPSAIVRGQVNRREVGDS